MALSANSRRSVSKPRSSPPRQRSLTTTEEEIWNLLDEAGLSSEISFMMRRAQLTLLECVFSRQGKIDLSYSQLMILRLIHSHPGLTQQRIADAMYIKKANLTVLINELVAENFVTRKSAPLNRKAYALHLTRSGERALAKARKTLSEQFSFMNDILDTEERARFIHSLRKIIQRLPPRTGRDPNSDAD